MAIPLRMSDELPPLVGIGGAGASGTNFARQYLEKVSEHLSSGCSLITLNGGEPAHPVVSIVIAFADDDDVRQELMAWAGMLQSVPSQLALFYIVGDLNVIGLPGPYVQFSNTVVVDRQLADAMNCVVQALAGHNLVNLRVYELREICAEARQLFFATGIGSGNERVRAAFDQALATSGMRERLQSARGIWVQITAPGVPELSEIASVGSFLRGNVHNEAIVHLGGMDLCADGNELCISMLVSTN